MVKNLLIGLIGLALALVLIGFLLPRQVHLERSIEIQAPQHTVFALLNGFPRFNEWSPWAGIDPETVYAYEGPSHGVGAGMSWQSDDSNVGTGSQKIVLSEAPTRIESTLDFGPQGLADSFFALEPAGEAVKVTWGFDTDLGMNPIGRWFGLFLGNLLGPDYERGLAQLKTLAESLPDTDFADLVAEHMAVESATIAYIKGETTMEKADIEAAMTEAYGKVTAFIGERGLTPTGPPIAINHVWEDGRYVFDGAIPVAETPAEEESDAESEVKIGSTYAGEALKVIHTGTYETMPATYDKAMAYLEVHGHELSGSPWDVWISDPTQVPEAELVTEIYLPLG